MKLLSANEFLIAKDPILDVRSPAEFDSGHIPGAINLPLFSDDERSEVGTLYKQSSREEAIKHGLDLVGPKMKGFIEAAESHESNAFRIYCWRGGMRSQSMAWLLGTYGMNIELLKGGYKAYRNEMLSHFQSSLQLRVLSGFTGSMKTEILLQLRELGEQVIDLEGCASHQGSSFGNVKSTSQPSTEHFHNLIFEELRHFDLKKRIWIEDESNMIGKVCSPIDLHKLKEVSPHIEINVPEEVRIAHLVKGYGGLEKEALIKGTEGVRKRLGHQKADEAIAFIKEGNLSEAVRIILFYYDRQYQKGMTRKEKYVARKVNCANMTIEEIARELKNGN